MRWTFVLAMLMLTGCQRTGADLDVYDVAPVEMRGEDSVHVSLVMRLDDCFGCQLQGGFIALRSMQQRHDGAPVVGVTTLLLTRRLDDTLTVFRGLKRERITTRIRTMAPRQARGIFHRDKIPAIYLIADGRIVRVWEPFGGRGIVIARNEISDALDEIWERM